jgi:hypothetical protein
MLLGVSDFKEEDQRSGVVPSFYHIRDYMIRT